MKWRIAVLLLWGVSVHGASLSASASASATCYLSGSAVPTTFTGSSNTNNTNPIDASALGCPYSFYSSANATASYGYLDVGGGVNSTAGPGAVDGSFQATSSFTDSITLTGGSTGTTAQFDLVLNWAWCSDQPAVGTIQGMLQFGGQTAIELGANPIGLCPSPTITSQYYDIELTPGQPVPFTVTLSTTGDSVLKLSEVGLLISGITIPGGLPAGERLVSESGFNYAAIPEPGATALIGTGLLLIWTQRRGRSK